MDKLSKANETVFFLGDFNIDLLNYDQHLPTNEFLDSASSDTPLPHIAPSTRTTSIFYNILRLFDVLPNFPSPQVKRCAIITYKNGISELPHDLPNDSRLKILGT